MTVLGKTLQKIRDQMNEFWQGRDKNQKIRLGIFAIIFIISIALLVFFTSRPELAPLYNQLSLEDAGVITEKLNEYKIKWKLDDVSSSILVPKKEVNKLRMQLATEGLPRSGFSLIDALDSTKLGTTDLERRERIRLGQEHAIAQAIETIEGVEYSQVNLYIPGDSVFALGDNDYESSAGILIKLQAGVELDHNRIEGILQFVSKSVKGLTKDNISIIDQTGRELSTEYDTQRGQLLGRLEIEQGIQERMQNSVRRFLETAYGKDNVDVRISLKLDYDSHITNIVRFEPPIPGEEEGLIRSIQELEEHAQNAGSGGVPGTDSNIEGITSYAQVDHGDSKYDMVSSTINYELNEIKEEIIKAQGQIQDLTVAVLINSTDLAEEFTQADADNVSDIVAAAVGIESRLVQVRSMPFDTSLAASIARGFEERQRTERMKYYTFLASIGILLIAGLVIYMIISRRRKVAREEMLAAQFDAEITDDIEDIELSEDLRGARKQVERFIDKKPELAAQLLKTWLKEE